MKQTKEKLPFLRWHIHSVHSQRDGMLKIKDLVQEAKNANEGFTLTDHGSISGWIECLAECKAQGIKPVLGVEFYVNNQRDRLLELSHGLIDEEKDPVQKKILQEERDSKKKSHHLVMVAKNQHGLMNILQLNNIGYVDGYYSKPLITYNEVLAMPNGPDGTPGVIVSSACLGGTMGQHLIHAKNHKDKGSLLAAQEWAQMMFDKFGEDFYIEVQSNGIDEQTYANKALIAIAKRIGVKVCIGMDSHYLKADWADTHQDLLLLQDKKTKADVGKIDYKITIENGKGERKSRKVQAETEFRKGFAACDIKVGDTFGKGKAKETVIDIKEVPRVWTFSTDKVWYKSEDELRTEVKKIHKELTEDLEEIFDTNREIFAKIEDVKLDTTIKLPTIGDAKVQLRQAVKDGLKNMGLAQRQYIDRIKEELPIIEENNFCEYFLILADIMKFARHNGIPIGCARGSATGSLVAYVMGIHRVDPLDERWGSPLPFERFLSGERNSRKVVVEDAEGNKHEMLELDDISVNRKGKTITIKAIDIKEGDELVLDIDSVLGV